MLTLYYYCITILNRLNFIHVIHEQEKGSAVLISVMVEVEHTKDTGTFLRLSVELCQKTSKKTIQVLYG